MNDKMIGVIHHYNEVNKARLEAQMQATRRRIKARRLARKAQKILDRLQEVNSERL